MNLYTLRLDTNQITSDDHTIELTYDTRQKSRFRATLSSGEDIGVDLPRTGVLRDGAIISTATGERLLIKAAPEKVMQAKTEDAFLLLTAAYHLGNRHVPLMLTPNAIFFEPDHVLAEMLNRLGLQVEIVMHPFEPETGAYAQHQHETRLRPLHVTR